MPIAPTVVARVDQVLQWLAKEYPCAYPVEVRWVPWLDPGDEGATAAEKRSGDWAHTYRYGRRYVIELSRRRCRGWELTVDTVLHEYAHARTWGYARRELLDKRPHGPAFQAEYGAIYEAYHDDHGWEHSREFEWRVR